MDAEKQKRAAWRLARSSLLTALMNHPLTQVYLTYFIASSPFSFIISTVISAAAYMSFTSSHSLTV